MTKLVDLRRHVADYTSDMADGKADRVILGLVNAALQELYAEHRWERFKKRATIDLDVGVAVAALVVTQDSAVVTGAAGDFLTKYYEEGWDLKITDDDTVLYRLAEKPSSPTTARLDKAWIATGGTKTATWLRSTYPLPDGFQTIRELQLSSSKNYLALLAPDVFDAERFDTPTETGVPRVYTVRETTLEVWPPLPTTGTRERIMLSYDRRPELFTSSSHADSVVDFDDQHRGLLLAALDVQIATRHRGQTQLDLGAALTRYQRLLSIAKGHDAQRVQVARQFGLRRQPTRQQVEEFYARRAPQGSDS